VIRALAPTQSEPGLGVEVAPDLAQTRRRMGEPRKGLVSRVRATCQNV